MVQWIQQSSSDDHDNKYCRHFLFCNFVKPYSGLLYMLVLSCWVCPGSCWWGDVIHYPEYVKWVEQFINNETPGTLLSAPPFYPVVQVILSKLVLGLSVPWRSRQGRGRMRMTMSQPSPTLSPGWQGAVVRSTRGWPESQWGTSLRRGQCSGTVLGRTIWIDWTGINSSTKLANQSHKNRTIANIFWLLGFGHSN